MIDLSFVFPTRGRIPYLKKTLDSIFGLAADPSRVEVVMMYDSDDIETRDFLLAYLTENEQHARNIQFHEVAVTPEMVAAGINIHELYFAPAACLSKGRYVWEIGNDIEIVTQDYDKIIVEECDRFLGDKPDRILYTIINHDVGYHGDIKFCCFPIFSREDINAVGCGTPKEITSWGADYFCWLIYNNLCENRILNIADKVALKHWSYHTKRTHKGVEVENLDYEPEQYEGDEISYRLRTNKKDLTREECIAYINKLNSAILNPPTK